MARSVWEPRGGARHGRARQARIGVAGIAKVQHGRRGVFWTGKERRGAVWQAWPVVDGFGGARYGRRGSERSGLAGTSKAGGARHDPEGCGRE